MFTIIKKRLIVYSKLNFGDSRGCYRGKQNVSAGQEKNYCEDKQLSQKFLWKVLIIMIFQKGNIFIVKLNFSNSRSCYCGK